MTALQQLLLGIAGYGGQYGNDISTLPHTITRLTRLTLLGLGGNPISVPAPLHYKVRAVAVALAAGWRGQGRGGLCGGCSLGTGRFVWN